MTKNDQNWLIGVKSDSKSIYEVKKFISLEMKELWPFIDIFRSFELFFDYKLNISQNIRAMKKFFLACIFRIECLYTVPKIKFTTIVEMHLTFCSGSEMAIASHFEYILRHVWSLRAHNSRCTGRMSLKLRVCMYNGVLQQRAKFEGRTSSILEASTPNVFWYIYLL